MANNDLPEVETRRPQRARTCRPSSMANDDLIHPGFCAGSEDWSRAVVSAAAQTFTTLRLASPSWTAGIFDAVPRARA